ncbi:hypothetical protein ACIRD3_20195 [Kitasatospora sp. NPDC093550]|uniref:hypothetical protein n=1 Tax=Kitasatospora sp. NPDC093550 TaxID=3364089 RepID=UPI00381694F2
MLTSAANGNDSRLSFWRRVREYAVPPSMIEAATARRLAGDWAGACAAANVEVDFRLGDVARTHGRELADRLRADLRRLAPDLLRWHLPRTAPDGLLRPGLTMPLARYPGERPVSLVVRTPPAWAEYGQRIALALWAGNRPGDGPRITHRYGNRYGDERGDGRSPHPHPHPSRRFRYDLHRHLWDAGRSGELADRAGGHAPNGVSDGDFGDALRLRAVDRWAAEAALLLRADGHPDGPVTVRLEGRHRLVLGPDGCPADASCDASALPLLPDAATWVPPDLDLLRNGAIEPERLHPLVAAALAPGHPRRTDRPDTTGAERLVDCRGAWHRIGLVDGALAPLDHDPAELRREELLSAFSGTPLPCLQAVDRAHRGPHQLDGIRERLVHGDATGALAVVEDLLGPEAVLRDGPLRDAFLAAAQRRIAYGRYRAGLTTEGPCAFPFRLGPPEHRRQTFRRPSTARPRHATFR